MEVWLTEGMFGKKLEKIADASTAEDAMAKIREWKSSKDTKAKYKTGLYDRLIFSESCIAVDFGSWSTFIQVDGLTRSALKQFTHIT